VLIARSPVSVRVAVASVHEIWEQRRCHTQCEHWHASHRAEPMRVSSHDALSSLTETLVRLPASPHRGGRTPPAMTVPWHWHGDASAPPILPSLPPWCMHRMHWREVRGNPYSRGDDVVFFLRRLWTMRAVLVLWLGAIAPSFLGPSPPAYAYHAVRACSLPRWCRGWRCVVSLDFALVRGRGLERRLTD
jgi:hypothetical protein